MSIILLPESTNINSIWYLFKVSTIIFLIELQETKSKIMKPLLSPKLDCFSQLLRKRLIKSNALTEQTFLSENILFLKFGARFLVKQRNKKKPKIMKF